MSIFAAQGLSIEVSTPVALGADILDNTHFQNPRSYGHVISAEIGFDSAKITIMAPTDYVDEWIENGMMRHIVIKNNAAQVVWEGFVNTLNTSSGGQKIKIGPMMQVVNSLRVSYAPILPSLIQQVFGTTVETTVVDDTDSQAKYGTFEGIYDAGAVEEAIAEDIRDAQLTDTAEPVRDDVLQSGASGIPTMTLDCLGYYYLLRPYFYLRLAAAASAVRQDAGVIIQTVLAGHPDSIFSTDYSKIGSNSTVQIPELNIAYQTGESIIKAIVSAGDGSIRYLFNIYENRRAYYAAVPTAAEYEWQEDNYGFVYTIAGARVDPWDIRPGKWIFDTTRMPGKEKANINVANSLRIDPRYKFIEKVTYTAPDQFVLNGSRNFTIEQRLGRFGLKGI